MKPGTSPLNLLSRQESEVREEEVLSPHAARSAETLGRLYPEEEHPLRTTFQRDRDRLIHSTAFRRLEYKTQVFVNHEGDYYRTRLTHTLEVVQIARSLARFLRLNEDLAEGMALAHDLGHTPFGHSVEEVMNELLEGEGGFEHNAQGLRSVDILETPYPDFPGLNLTYEVRSIFTKKSSMASLRETGFASPHSGRFDAGPARPILEAQIVDLADGIAYNSHDVDDGLKSGLISALDLGEVPLWAEVWNEARGEDESIRRHSAVRELINRQVTDAALETMRRMESLAGGCGEERCAPSYPALSQVDRVVDFSSPMRSKDTELKSFLRSRLYRHPQVTRQMDRARIMIRALFATYTEQPAQMAPQFRIRADREPVRRVVGDYIAGMTDRFAEDEYVRCKGPDGFTAS
jgi:dGTPase